MDEPDFENDIVSCIETLKNGGTILYPTDTVWGIGCDATNPKAVEKIFELKQRASGRSLIVLLADSRDLNIYTSHLHPHIIRYLENTDSPTTVVYDGAIGFADNLIGADGSIAIRIIREKFCRHLIKRFRKPLVSTSANLSGERTPANFKQIAEPILNGVDYIVHYRQNDERQGSPSALIRFDKNGEPIIIRAGLPGNFK
jgi:L-threonylcarbamoyladenylate synthase